MEAEPIDFGAFKAKRDAAKTRSEMPGSLRYASAHAKQNPSPAASVSDYLRDIVLRNLDAAFGHGTWDPDDYHKLTTYLKAMNALQMSQVHGILSSYLSKLAKQTGVIYSMQFPNRRDAYLHDDPSQATYRLQKRGKGLKPETETFPSRPALYMHVIQMIDPEQADLSDEETATIGKFTVAYEDHLARSKEGDPSAPDPRFPGGRPVDTWADDEEPFDPDAVPTYAGKPDQHYVIPAVEKFLKQFASSDEGDDPAYIWVDHGYGGDPISINFVSRNEPKRKQTFPNLRALERWVLAHKAGIQRWYDMQHADGDRLSDRILPKVTRAMLSLLRMVLQARETDAAINEEQIAALANKIYDMTDYIKNGQVRDLFQSLVFDIKRPNMRQFITPYHLEWLPERIRELTGSA